jgi:glutaredoxin-like protein
MSQNQSNLVGTGSEQNVPVMAGKKVPEVSFRVRENDQWKAISSADLFADKTVVLFSLPGAFTPTCSSAHLPRYNELASTFTANGVDDIICMSVNDTFVMNAWKEDQEAENITVIPDGNGEFTDGMGMLVSKEDLGFGKRSWRYSMLVKNGVVEKMFVEPDVAGDPFEVSDADTMLDYINPQASKPQSVAMITKPGCPYCTKAKVLLNERGIEFEEIILGKDATSVSVKAISGNSTVPQIFFDGKNIGGSDDLAQYLSES